MATLQVTHGDLRNGDLNWRQGHLFIVTDLVHTKPTCGHKGAQWHQAAKCEACADEQAGRVLVRFTGRVARQNDDIRNTGYDGGRYGAWADVAATVEAIDMFGGER